MIMRVDILNYKTKHLHREDDPISEISGSHALPKKTGFINLSMSNAKRLLLDRGHVFDYM